MGRRTVKRLCEAFTHNAQTHHMHSYSRHKGQEPAETSTPWLPLLLAGCCGGASCATSSCSAWAVQTCVVAWLHEVLIGCNEVWRTNACAANGAELQPHLETDLVLVLEF